MISYEVYKVMHLLSLFAFLATSVMMLLQPDKKLYKALSGVFSLLALTGGMGLMARLGSGMQLWIVLKLTILILLTGFLHMIAKRKPELGPRVVWAMVFWFGVAGALATYKPL